MPHAQRRRWNNRTTAAVSLLAVTLALSGCGKKLGAGPKAAAAATSLPVVASRPVATASDSGGFTDMVKSDTALIGRGDSDRDVIFDTVAAGTKVRAISVSGGYARVITSDGRDGLIDRERLRSLLPPNAPTRKEFSWVAEPDDQLVWLKPTREKGAGDAAADKITAAIVKGIAYLKSKRNKDGGWNRGDGGEGLLAVRPTALACLAVIEGTGGGVDDEVKKAIELLSQESPPDVFGDSMRLEVLSLAPRHTQDKALHEDEMIAAVRSGTSADSVEYRAMFYDRTTTPMARYSILRGMAAADRAGAEIPTNFWSASETMVKKEQHADGGWTDGLTRPGRLNSSSFRSAAAGVLSLRITEDHLDRVLPYHYDAGAGNVMQPNYFRGMGWIRSHVGEMWDDLNAGKIPNPCQTLWWLNEVIAQTGERRIHGSDCGAMIADWLIRSQRADGSWGDVDQTAYAVRTLASLAAPVGFGKLVYPPEGLGGSWNERPRDVANMTANIGRRFQNALQWQVVRPSDPISDFDRLPVLYIGGNSELKLDDDTKAKLRQYVEHGGLIFGNADDGNKPFAASFEKLGRELFPQYEFCPLSKTHVIEWDEMYRPTKRWKTALVLRGMSNGVRELMLIPDADFARAWQNQLIQTHSEAFELATNIYLYAVAMHPERVRSEGLYMPRSDAKASTLRVARIQAGDNWNPEPYAWPRMTDVVLRRSNLQLTITTIRLGEGKLTNYEFAHFTGTTKFALTAAKRAELKAFVDNGGTILIDAAGGSTEFADSAQRELKEIFGDEAAQLADPLPPDQFSFGGALANFHGIRLYRMYARKRMAGELWKPRLRAIVRNGRIAVFYSREDLTAAMAGVQSDGILGYEVDAGTELVGRILQYVTNNPGGRP